MRGPISSSLCCQTYSRSRTISPVLLDELLRLFPDLRRISGPAWVVGGAIRDLLLNRQPADVDVACPDPLQSAQTLRRKVIRLGREHLTAYRVAGAEHLYDFAEVLDGDIRRDLARRDFTVNAMAVDLRSGELLDPHGGRADLAHRVVRMIDASNFDDDPLRMLKAVRMAVALSMGIDDATVEAIRRRAAKILGVAPERVSYELSVIFGSNAFRSAVTLLHETGLDVPLFGRDLDAAVYRADDVPPGVAFALLVRNPRAFAERWRWSEARLREVLTLQQLLEHGAGAVALYDAGEEIAGQFRSQLRALGSNDSLPMPDFTMKALLSGDAIAGVTGVEPGRALGDIKRALLEAQIEGKVTTAEEAEAFVMQAARRMRA
jgi:hypothetical protein